MRKICSISHVNTAIGLSSAVCELTAALTMRLRPFAPAFAPPRCYVRAYRYVLTGMSSLILLEYFLMHLGGGYRTHSIECRFLYKVGTPHNIENDLFNVFFLETLIE